MLYRPIILDKEKKFSKKEMTYDAFILNLTKPRGIISKLLASFRR